jgi:hypothetical protein
MTKRGRNPFPIRQVIASQRNVWKFDSADWLVCNGLRDNGLVWLAALDDFRNWLIREAA